MTGHGLGLETDYRLGTAYGLEWITDNDQRAHKMTSGGENLGRDGEHPIYGSLIVGH